MLFGCFYSIHTHLRGYVQFTSNKYTHTLLIVILILLERVPFVAPDQRFSFYVCMAITYSKGNDKSGKVANPTRGQLNRENEYFPVPVRA